MKNELACWNNVDEEKKMKRVKRENSTTFPTLSLIHIQYVFLYSSESKPDWSIYERASRSFSMLISSVQLEKQSSVYMIWAYSTSFPPLKIPRIERQIINRFNKIINEKEKKKCLLIRESIELLQKFWWIPYRFILVAFNYRRIYT